MNCKICNRPLNESQYSADGEYKSCPRCSVINGEEHVYFKYKGSAFGNTPKRKTFQHPDGPQSYCTVHRSNTKAPIPEGYYLCSDFIN